MIRAKVTISQKVKFVKKSVSSIYGQLESYY